jgi:hypothetical protein
MTAGPTRKWYDGADRLVEVQQPTDPNYDCYTFPWRTRYLYDLTQGGTVTIGSSPAYSAYGGLFKTQAPPERRERRRLWWPHSPEGPPRSVANSSNAEWWFWREVWLMKC